jgi:hypothetical protein
LKANNPLNPSWFPINLNIMYLSLSLSTNHVIVHAFIDQLISTIKVMKLLKKSFYKAPSTYLQLDYELVNPGKKNKGYLN